VEAEITKRLPGFLDQETLSGCDQPYRCGEVSGIGIFTGRDAVNRVLAAGKEGNHTKLAEAMTSNPITMSPNKTAIDALRLMWDGGFRHIPIVENRKALGVISRGDFKSG